MSAKKLVVCNAERAEIVRSATEPGRLLRVGALHAVEQAGATGATERESPPTRFLTRYQIGRNGYSNLSGNKLWRLTVPSQFVSSTHMDDYGVYHPSEMLLDSTRERVLNCR